MRLQYRTWSGRSRRCCGSLCTESRQEVDEAKKAVQAQGVGWKVEQQQQQQQVVYIFTRKLFIELFLTPASTLVSQLRADRLI